MDERIIFTLCKPPAIRKGELGGYDMLSFGEKKNNNNAV